MFFLCEWFWTADSWFITIDASYYVVILRRVVNQRVPQEVPLPLPHDSVTRLVAEEMAPRKGKVKVTTSPRRVWRPRSFGISFFPPPQKQREDLWRHFVHPNFQRFPRLRSYLSSKLRTQRRPSNCLGVQLLPWGSMVAIYLATEEPQCNGLCSSVLITS